MTRLALTRPVPPTLNACELTHLEREPIDVDRARRQHAAYEALLAELGCEIVRVPGAPDMPDSVFIEDTAVVTDDVAVITRPGAASRRGETAAVAEVLGRWRRVLQIHAPGTVDGGDVLLAGGDLFVGISSRTNLEGARQLAHILDGHAARFVPVHGTLHLKSAVTAIGEGRVLMNPEWIDRETFRGYDIVEVDPSEPYAANALCIDGVVVCAAAFPRTCERIGDIRLVEVSELAKAEGALTCCSILLSV